MSNHQCCSLNEGEKYPDVAIIMSNNTVSFMRETSRAIEFNLTNKEMNQVFYQLLEYVRKLDKHRGYFDYRAEVHITKIKTQLSYGVDLMKFIVTDKRAETQYEMLNEDEAKNLVDLLRDKYRE